MKKLGNKELSPLAQVWLIAFYAQKPIVQAQIMEKVFMRSEYRGLLIKKLMDTMAKDARFRKKCLQKL